MVWAWQQWLSPRPLHRTKNNSETSFPYLGNASLYEPLSKPNGLWYVKETHNAENSMVRAGMSGPPLHIHRLQDEFFEVEKGTLGVYRNGVEHALTKDDGIFHIPAGTRHRFFYHKSNPEDLVFNVWVDPCDHKDHIFDVNFLRNITGYLTDCVTSEVQPSVFQIILFFEHASSLMCPPFLDWMPLWLHFWVHRGLAWWATAILGYSRSYPEYSRYS